MQGVVAAHISRNLGLWHVDSYRLHVGVWRLEGRPTQCRVLATCFKRIPEPDKNASSEERTEKNFRGETQGKLLLPAVVIVIPVLGCMFVVRFCPWN